MNVAADYSIVSLAILGKPDQPLIATRNRWSGESSWPCFISPMIRFTFLTSSFTIPGPGREEVRSGFKTVAFVHPLERYNWPGQAASHNVS